MTRITRQDFTAESPTVADDLYAHFLPPPLEATLTRAGIDRQDLLEVAGRDQVIAGDAEWGALFAKLRRREDGGRDRSLDADSPQGQAARALLEHVETERTRASARVAERRAGPPPRVPSEASMEGFRARWEELDAKLESVSRAHVQAHDGRAVAALVTADLFLETVELGHFAGAHVPILSGGFTALFAPALSTLAVLAEIGEANLAAAAANQRRTVERAYASGIAAALDEAGGPAPPADPERRALHDAGRRYVDAMSPWQRRELEDTLVLGLMAARDPSFTDPHAVDPSAYDRKYHARTYQRAFEQMF